MAPYEPFALVSEAILHAQPVVKGGFEQETGDETCGFVEDPKDELDWVIASSKKLLHDNNNVRVFVHLEETTGQDIQRGGKYLWIEKRSEEFQTSMARIVSPTYQNTRADCVVRFWYYINGNLGNYYIKPALHPIGADMDIMLDFLSEDLEWKTKTISIGRRRGPFQVLVIFNSLA